MYSCPYVVLQRFHNGGKLYLCGKIWLVLFRKFIPVEVECLHKGGIHFLAIMFSRNKLLE